MPPGPRYDPGYDPGYGPQDVTPESSGRLGQPRGSGGLGGSGGFGGFPFPHYTTRTKRGTQVTVAGCCLPIPLGCLTACAAAAVVGAVQLKRRLA